MSAVEEWRKAHPVKGWKMVRDEADPIIAKLQAELAERDRMLDRLARTATLDHWVEIGWSSEDAPEDPFFEKDIADLRARANVRPI